MPPVNYTICRFLREDVATYKAIRLEALQNEPGVFGNSYEYETGLTDERWLARIAGTNSAIFALYEDNILIGITGIVIPDAEKPEEAHLAQSYIRQPFRGKGLSRFLYEARIQWAREHGVKKLVVGHKASNLSSKAANQKFGFVYTHTESRNWPDGVTEDILHYELIL